MKDYNIGVEVNFENKKASTQMILENKVIKRNNNQFKHNKYFVDLTVKEKFSNNCYEELCSIYDDSGCLMSSQGENIRSVLKVHKHMYFNKLSLVQ